MNEWMNDRLITHKMTAPLSPQTSLSPILEHKERASSNAIGTPNAALAAALADDDSDEEGDGRNSTFSQFQQRAASRDRKAEGDVGGDAGGAERAMRSLDDSGSASYEDSFRQGAGTPVASGHHLTTIKSLLQVLYLSIYLSIYLCFFSFLPSFLSCLMSAFYNSTNPLSPFSDSRYDVE